MKVYAVFEDGHREEVITLPDGKTSARSAIELAKKITDKSPDDRKIEMFEVEEDFL